MKKLLLLLFFVAHPYASAGDIFNDQKARPFTLSDTLEPDATIAGYPIWNGEGKWRIFNIEKRESSGNGDKVPIGDVELFQTEGKSFVAMMKVSANLGGASIKWLGDPCKREDMLYKASVGKSVWQDNCVTINHISGFYANPPTKGVPLYARLKEQGIEIPPTILQIQFTRNGSGGNFINTVLSINPELMGFARETEPNWGRNPWNKTQSFNDPVKKQFIDALSAWALKFANQMDSGLDKKPDAFSTIPSWRTVLNGQAKPDANKPKILLD